MLLLKKSASVLERFKGSMVKALIHSFPDLHLDPSLFDTISSIFSNSFNTMLLLLTLIYYYVKEKYWNNVDNRKKFFIDYAARNHFDPLVANNWYNVPRDDIIAEKV